MIGLEEMKILCDKGIDCSKSSMYYLVKGPLASNIPLVKTSGFENIPKDWIIPAFTLEDILNILPAYSLIKTINGTIRIGAKCGDNRIEYKGNSELEVAYKMLIWCIDNNYIK